MTIADKIKHDFDNEKMIAIHVHLCYVSLYFLFSEQMKLFASYTVSLSVYEHKVNLCWNVCVCSARICVRYVSTCVYIVFVSIDAFPLSMLSVSMCVRYECELYLSLWACWCECSLCLLCWCTRGIFMCVSV